MVSPHDKEVLQTLAHKMAEIAALPVHKKTIDLWKKHNSLQQSRPMIWMREIPWHELGPDLECVCEDELCRFQENRLRRVLYQWKHMRVDMVVEPVIACPIAIESSGFGVKTHSVYSESGGSADYESIIKEESDIDKISYAHISVDKEETERRMEQSLKIFDGIIQVKKRGYAGLWQAPWDILVTWWGIEELYIDMYTRPELVHKGMRRMMDVTLDRLDQIEKLNLLDLNNNHRGEIGSGGIGWTDELPGPDFDPEHIRAHNLWGTSAAQIFSEVSPEMHEEFATKYEAEWLKRFGLACYGCCEPLHLKVDRLRRHIPNLRRISMSPYVDIDKGAEAIGSDFIYSYKPNPNIFAFDKWDADLARSLIRDVFERTKGCNIELTAKDITTCKNEPHRLWEWAQIAIEEAEAWAQ